MVPLIFDAAVASHRAAYGRGVVAGRGDVPETRGDRVAFEAMGAGERAAYRLGLRDGRNAAKVAP